MQTIDHTLRPYICRLRPSGEGCSEYFACLAEDEAHAVEQAINANPGFQPDRVKHDERSKDQYLIFSVCEGAFWSNKQGWVSSSALATRFAAHEKRTVSLPATAENDATWLTRYEVQYLAADAKLKRLHAAQSVIQ